MVRVIDLFREWDDDNTGSVNKKEFRKAMPMLGLNVDRKELDIIFDEWDADKSGQIAISELNDMLRKRVELDPSLMPGGAGEIELKRDQKYAIRKDKVDKGNSMLIQGIDIDESKPVADQLRDALATNMVRVIDLFKEWDDDNTGTVSKKEFRKAMPMMGLSVSKEEMDAIFDEWDDDKSGVISIKELNTKLKKRIAIDPKLMPGAAGEIEINRDQKIALRKGKVNKDDANLLQGFDIDENSGVSIAEQLRGALTQNSVRVIEMFRQWDDDGSGTITKKEFIKAMLELGLELSKKDIGNLFDGWDPDGSGMIELAELNKMLRAGSAVNLDSKLKPGGAGEIELGVDQKVKTRKAKVNKADSTLLQGLNIDENSDVPVGEQITAVLKQNSVRIIDLFREWDDDASGSIEKGEFLKAMKMMGLEVPKGEAVKLFDSWDPDGSGKLELKELEKILKAKAGSKGAPPPKADAKGGKKGGAAKGGNKSPSKEAPAKPAKAAPAAAAKPAAKAASAPKEAPTAATPSKESKDASSAAAAAHVEEKSASERLYDALSLKSSKLLELVKEWDEDASGHLSSKEFRQVLPALGITASRETADELFATLDADSSGSVDYNELASTLSKRAKKAAKPASHPKPAKNSGATQRMLSQVNKLYANSIPPPLSSAPGRLPSIASKPKKAAPPRPPRERPTLPAINSKGGDGLFLTSLGDEEPPPPKATEAWVESAPPKRKLEPIAPKRPPDAYSSKAKRAPAASLGPPKGGNLGQAQMMKIVSAQNEKIHTAITRLESLEERFMAFAQQQRVD